MVNVGKYTVRPMDAMGIVTRTTVTTSFQVGCLGMESVCMGGLVICFVILGIRI